MQETLTNPSQTAETVGAGAALHAGAPDLFAATAQEKSREAAVLVLWLAIAMVVVWGAAELAAPSATPRVPLGADSTPAAAVNAPQELPAAAGPTPAPAANFDGKVASVSGTVWLRSAGEPTWRKARAGRLVHSRDEIQTPAGASALIKLPDQGDIRVGENSLVAFEPNSADAFLAGAKPVASVSRGALTGRLKSRDDRDVLGIRLPNAAVRVQGGGPDRTAAFDLRVSDDRSASIVILRGRARVRGPSGVRTLGSGEGAQISADGRRVTVESIPPVPKLIEPQAGQTIVYHKEPPELLFRWEGATTVDDYRFVLAADPEFRSALVDERVTGTRYAHAGLGSGQYYWKVSGRRGWLQSPATDAASLLVERDIDVAVRETLADLYRQSDSARDLVARAQGVLVFPRVIKGGLIVGGEYGEGALLSGGRTVDYYTMKSASLGLQLGGQTRKVALLFMTPEAYEGFLKSNGWKAGVDGSVTLASLGVGKALDAPVLGKPVIGFVFSNKGLMYNLTLEGSRISRMQD